MRWRRGTFRGHRSDGARAVATAAAIAIAGAALGVAPLGGTAAAGTDAAPQVESTVPLDGETGIPTDATIVVELSEDVVLDDPGWITVECGISGSHGGTTTGSDRIWSFDPDVDFAPAEECVATIVASAVRDADSADPPDLLPRDVEFFFATAGGPRDTTPPVVTVRHVADGAADWNVTTPVPVSIVAADQVVVSTLDCTVGGAAAVLDPPFAPGHSYSGSVVVTGDGEHAIRCRARDGHGNAAEATDTVRVDTVAPVSAVTGVVEGQVVVAGVDGEPDPGCTTTDAGGSGVATVATPTVDASGLDPRGLGPVVVRCDGGVDVAGNGDVPAVATYRIVPHEVGIVLAPLPSDAGVVRLRGPIIPVRFRVTEPLVGADHVTWALERGAADCADGAVAGPGPGEAVPVRGEVRRIGRDRIAIADLRDVPGGSCWRIRAVSQAGQATRWSAPFLLTR